MKTTLSFKINLFIYQVLRRKRCYFSIALLGFLAVGYEFAEDRLSDRQLITSLSNNPYGFVAKVKHFIQSDRPMRYVEIGKDDRPLIVFIHGAPSSSAFWLSLLRDSLLLRKAKLLAVDRPGYGYSGYGKPEVSVKKQAALIATILKEKRKTHRKIIVDGSSYGGTVTSRLAMDYPELVDGILLQSASTEPGAETTYWISYPTSHWSLKWLIPGSIQVANSEKLSHKTQLEAMTKGWERIRSACILLHGEDDTLIDPSNLAYARERLRNARVLESRLFAGSKHDLLWTQRQALVQSLLKLVDLAKPSGS